MNTTKVFNFFNFVLFISFLILDLSCDNSIIKKHLTSFEKIDEMLKKKKKKRIKLIVILCVTAGLAIGSFVLGRIIYKRLRKRRYHHRMEGNHDFFDDDNSFSKYYNNILSLASKYMSNEFYKSSDKGQMMKNISSHLQKVIDNAQYHYNVTLSDYELRCMKRELYRRIDVKYFDFLNSTHNKKEEDKNSGNFTLTNISSAESQVPSSSEVVNANYMKALDIAKKAKEQLEKDFSKSSPSIKASYPKKIHSKGLIEFMAKREGYELTEKQIDELSKDTHLFSINLYYDYMSKNNPKIKKPKLKTYNMDMNVFSILNKKSVSNQKKQIILDAEYIEHH